MTLFAIFIGGGLGSLVRFLLSRIVTDVWTDVSIPLGTLAVNICACLVLALVLMHSHRFPIGGTLRPMFLIGFCGGLSTFSTFSYELVVLLKTGHVLAAVCTIILNVLLCVGVLYWLLHGSHIS